MPITRDFNRGAGRVNTATTVTAGSTSDPIWLWNISPPITVTAIPGGGGTLNVQYTTSPADVVESGSATWLDWAGGAVAVAASDILLGPVTAIRGVAATADATLEVAC
jgi:hypothetical protein